MDKTIISLLKDSEYKQVQDLYKAGFTYEQIEALTKFLVAYTTKNFTKINSSVAD